MSGNQCRAFYVIHSFPRVRYDHLSVLCELMPVGLPSLAACLQTLLHGQFSAEAQSKATELLGVSSVEVDAMERCSLPLFDEHHNHCVI